MRACRIIYTCVSKKSACGCAMPFDCFDASFASIDSIQSLVDLGSGVPAVPPAQSEQQSHHLAAPPSCCCLSPICCVWEQKQWEAKARGGLLWGGYCGLRRTEREMMNCVRGVDQRILKIVRRVRELHVEIARHSLGFNVPILPRTGRPKHRPNTNQTNKSTGEPTPPCAGAGATNSRACA